MGTWSLDNKLIQTLKEEGSKDSNASKKKKRTRRWRSSVTLAKQRRLELISQGGNTPASEVEAEESYLGLDSGRKLPGVRVEEEEKRKRKIIKFGTAKNLADLCKREH